MKCPACQAPMQEGRVSIDRPTTASAANVADFLTRGGQKGPRCILFREDGDGVPVEIDHSRDSHYCPTCQALFVAGTKPVSEPPSPARPPSDKSGLNCPACGAGIEPDQARCPDCGIALDASPPTDGPLDFGTA
jgi:hypothetical protein